MSLDQGFSFDFAASDPSEHFQVVCLLPDKVLKKVALKLAVGDARLVTIGDYKRISEDALVDAMKSVKVDKRTRARFLDRIQSCRIKTD